jgi:hypothetical protein
LDKEVSDTLKIAINEVQVEREEGNNIGQIE